MGSKRLIAAIIIVILLIAAVIGGYFYLQNGSMQASILQTEMKKLAETDILKDEIDMQTKTSGKYAVVEETVKTYLNDVRNTYIEVKEYGNEEEVSKILSAKNIEQDSTELSVVDQKISEYAQKLEEIKNKTEKIEDENAIIEAIEQKDIKDSYIDVYKNIMLDDTIQSKLTSAKQQIEIELENAFEKIDGLEKVASFLKDNTKYWELNEGKIQFTNVNKLAEYYQLLNDSK